MASSKVMTSSNSRNSDLTMRPTANPSPVIPNYASNPNPAISGEIAGNSNTKTTSLMTLDGFLRNVYGENPEGSTTLEAEIPLIDAAGAITAVGDDGAEPSIRRQISCVGGGRKTVDDVWRKIVEGKAERKECKVEASEEMMTLEDFLAKNGAVEEEDVKVLAPVHAAGMERLSSGAYSFEPVVPSPYLPPAMVEGQVIGGVGRRGKRRGGAIMEAVDKATQQRQKRMIKNRESAARSRERKQAYQVELESLAGKLEEENEQLQKEKAEWTKERYNQLMEKVVPVVEKKKPPRLLRRVHSMQW